MTEDYCGKPTVWDPTINGQVAGRQAPGFNTALGGLGSMAAWDMGYHQPLVTLPNMKNQRLVGASTFLDFCCPKMSDHFWELEETISHCCKCLTFFMCHISLGQEILRWLPAANGEGRWEESWALSTSMEWNVPLKVQCGKGSLWRWILWNATRICVENCRNVVCSCPCLEFLLRSAGFPQWRGPPMAGARNPQVPYGNMPEDWLTGHWKSFNLNRKQKQQMSQDLNFMSLNLWAASQWGIPWTTQVEACSCWVLPFSFLFSSFGVPLYRWIFVGSDVILWVVPRLFMHRDAREAPLFRLSPDDVPTRIHVYVPNVSHLDQSRCHGEHWGTRPACQCRAATLLRMSEGTTLNFSDNWVRTKS